MLDEFIFVLYIDHLVKILALVWIILLIIVGVLEFRIARRKKVFLDKATEQLYLLNHLLDKPYKDVKSFLAQRGDKTNE
ncbi:hypothetical protein AWH56_010655 [Anaerobacillus isosaccharinicus]|uniref:Uncharacterized protein n=1 Tax=Anaerobacillus isosaccharinicus TaxID=1532552 RepID=A0A1S2L802_9BACI|nr:hypothetical protein [Anaerobacillus isosaccharinicus]MBA5588609.1 hypothetical protein [Anaerobacillus isosaccharinicus]QOY37980.1 hypothetical protein AWH56_010655 [Anaerobacillus isosaccharinicus]